jgi:hypothetical protein
VSKKAAQESSNRPVLLPKVHKNTDISPEAIARIRKAVGITRDFSDAELRHWLNEAKRQYHTLGMNQVPWQQVIIHSQEIEVAAKRLFALMRKPETAEAFPAVGGNYIEDTIANLQIMLQHVKQSPTTLRRTKDQRLHLQGISADCVLKGGNLPFIFSILWGDVRKGEAQSAVGHASDRFVAACCAELGLGVPTPDAIDKIKTRYSAQCLLLGFGYLRYFKDRGAGLMPPRTPSTASAARIADWFRRIEEAEERVFEELNK